MHLKNTLKSIGAVVAGFLTVVVLSIGTDAIVEAVCIFPPQDRPQDYVAWMLLLALLYRCAYTVLGGYVTAKLSPQNAARHVLVLGILGTLGGLSGTIAAWNLGNHWYPIALTVTALPCTWLGGRWYVKSK